MAVTLGRTNGLRGEGAKWYQNGWTECNQECIIKRAPEVLCILSVLWRHFAVQWKSKWEQGLLSWDGELSWSAGLLTSYSVSCLHDSSALWGNEVATLWLTQECSICRTFFVVTLISSFFLICIKTLTVSHCATLFHEMSPEQLWKVWCFELKGSPVLACVQQWAWLESDPCCWINADFFLLSAYLTAQSQVGL